MGTLKKLMRRRLARVWLHSRHREIALAVILTVAAAAFMTVALLRSSSGSDTHTQATQRKLTTR